MKMTNWHPADIIAGLRKKGTNLADLSRRSGLSPSTLGNALVRPWPKGEALIAQALNVSPEEIWPSRYLDKDGKPISRRFRRTDKNAQSV